MNGPVRIERPRRIANALAAFAGQKALLARRPDADSLPAPVVGAPAAVARPPLALATIRERVPFYSFLAAVLLPTLLAFIYFFFIASNEYVVETRFVVRSAQEQKDPAADAMSSLSRIGLGGGSKSVYQDGAIVMDYIRSRAIIDDLGGRARLAQVYGKGNIFSAIRSDPTIEDAWRYWNSKVAMALDTPSGIVTVKIRAFVPDDALQMANSVLTRSEALINDISDRSRADAMRFAESELNTSTARLSKARGQLLDFRNRNVQIDPGREAQSTADILTQLLQQRIDLETKLSVRRSSLAADSPTQRISQAQVDAIDEQIAGLRAKLIGQKNDAAISAQLAQFDDLQLSVKFAERLLTTAQNAYERARLQSERQQLYLVPIVKPMRPEYPLFPHAAFNTAMVALAALLLWGLVFLVAAAVGDHIE